MSYVPFRSDDAIMVYTNVMNCECFMMVLTCTQQYSAVNLGPLHKKDVMKASVMLEHDSQ